MGTAKWIYDAVLYIYALSLLFYFSDFMHANRRAKRIGTGLLIFVWVLQSAYLVQRLTSLIQMDVVSLSGLEYWFIFSWLMITITLVIHQFFYIDYVVFFVNIIGFAVFALHLYSETGEGQSLDIWQATRELLFVHISLVLCAYATLTIGAVLAGMYMYLHYRLKSKRWSQAVRRFPSLDRIERYMDRTIVIGVPLLALSLAIAIISLLVEGKAILLLDWKVVTSFLSLLIFVIYVYMRALDKYPGQQLAKLNIVAFVILVFNFMTSSLSSFH
ncbi:cytochrome C assembly family protein [Paenibacillus chungangensis]|uniref:Inner membrane protein YpjD n=1 Tax=Paenibacillus chungangensis TaxID=696535 RepID=A0ABW3HXM3_9BACL